MPYADLEIRILAKQSEGYPVELTLDGEQEFPRGFLDPAFLPWLATADPAKDGLRLFAWLLGDDKLKAAWTSACGRQPERRVRLRIDADAPELHTVPWELLRDPGDGATPHFIAATSATPFSRYLAGPTIPGHPILKRPIRILLAVANPANLGDFSLAALDPAQEEQALRVALGDGEVELVVLPQPCTLPALETELRNGYHVLHFVGHGQFDTGRRQPVLVLANAANELERVAGDRLTEMLANQIAGNQPDDDRLRLVYLSSCQTATTSPAGAFRGLAPQLVAAGVPAVLAMQDLVPVETAQAFAAAFYRRLLQHGQADLAANEARSSVASTRLPGAAIPVFFQRLRGGQLFGQRGQVLGQSAEGFWNTLLENIADADCTPFLGPGVTTGLLPSPLDLAHKLAADYGYPFAETQSLARVAQFVGTLDNLNLRRQLLRGMAQSFRARMQQHTDPADRTRSLPDVIAAANYPACAHAVMETVLHRQLADLNLPLYITTTYDNFMELALQSNGRTVRSEITQWRDQPGRSGEQPHITIKPDPAPDSPVVLHLYGMDNGKEAGRMSLVLTEDDYLDYVARLARNYEFMLPTNVQERLASTTLLFLGYRLEDLDLKVILRGLLTNLDLQRWRRLHVAVQIEAALPDPQKEAEVHSFFQRYFADFQIEVYWGTTQQFVNELHARWQEFAHA